MHNVGLDYSHMMESRIKEATEDSNGDRGVLSKEVKDVAKENGIIMLNIVSC